MTGLTHVVNYCDQLKLEKKFGKSMTVQDSNPLPRRLQSNALTVELRKQ